MAKTSTSIVIGLILVIGGIFFLFKNTANAPAVPNTQENTPAATPKDPAPTVSPTSKSTPAPKAGEYTLADVGKHNNVSSCWSAVNGGVYDLTSWIGSHPGGEQAIKSICGKDGSAAFNGQHDGAQKQAEILATFKIGVLVN